MDSHVIVADLACDQAEYSGDYHNPPKSCSGQKQQLLGQLITPLRVSVLCFACAHHEPPKSCSDQKQQVLGQLITPPRVSVLCFACAQPRWESEWNFSIEEVPFNNIKNKSSSVKIGDFMTENGKRGKSQKMRKNMGRVIYHRQPPVLLCA